MNNNEKLSIRLQSSLSGLTVTVEGSQSLAVNDICHLLKVYIRKALVDERFPGMEVLAQNRPWDPSIVEGPNGSFVFDANPKSGWPLDRFTQVVERAARKIAGSVKGAVVVPATA